MQVLWGGPSGISPNATSFLVAGRRSDQFGASVACAGDVNGDGFGDLVVAPSSSDGESEAGSVSVFLGGASGLSAAASVLRDSGPGEHLGASVAAAGDVNGDGYADIVVGAPWATAAGRVGAGAASVFQGTAMGIIERASVVIAGSAYDHLGVSVACACGPHALRPPDRWWRQPVRWSALVCLDSPESSRSAAHDTPCASS